MTRLIEALKKAEEAKRKEESSGLSLELEDSSVSQDESKGEQKPTPETAPSDTDLSLEPAFPETEQKEPEERPPTEDVYEAAADSTLSYEIEEGTQPAQDTDTAFYQDVDELDSEDAVGRRLTDQTAPSRAEPAAQRPAKTSKKRLLILVAIALLLLVGGFALFYWQLNSESTPYANIDPATQNRGFLDSTTAQDNAAPGDLESTETEPVAQQTQTEQTQTTIGPVSEPPENPAQPEVDETISVVNALLVSPEQTEPEVSVVSQRPTVFTIETPQRVAGSQDALNFARANIRQGEWEAAKSELNAILRAQPNNLRALEYMAQVHVEEGNVNQAETIYARILQLDPQNSTAQAGLVRVSRTNSLDYEATLLTLQNSYPDRAFIPFMLGNHFARQQRWSEASGSYQQAISLAADAGNIPAQYVYNFAVSLEHLRNTGAALAQYKRAETLVTEGDSINVALINTSIERLEARLEP